MRVIIYGLGAVGGSIAARLALTGTPVIGIARGAMLNACQANGGLTLLAPEGPSFAKFDVVDHPDRIDWQPDDIVMLAMKSNDTEAALTALAACGVDRQPIICAQNGVANEYMALRRFANVFALVLMMPAQYLEPGTVALPGAPKKGLFDIGRVPSGNHGVPPALIEALTAAGFACDLRDDAMAGKYGKLLLNLGNAIEATLGRPARSGPWNTKIRAEAEAVLTAAGISYYNVDKDHPRREQMSVTPIPGLTLAGNSTVQSLVRGTGAVETDYLNGEIVYLGRLHGIPTPVNAAFQRAAWQMARDGIAPANFPEAEIARLVAGA